MKKRIVLDSSAISLVVYNDEDRTLDVQFRDGGKYRYFNVPSFLHEALLNADSAGSFWNSIKDNYRFEKLD